MKKHPYILIVGAGPAGLISAETLAKENFSVTIVDRMPSPARKFLMAGHGGLNLTNSEDIESFIPRYGAAAKKMEKALRAFSPSDLRAWADDFGQETFVGTSGRVFPKGMKAASLVQKWREKLEKLGVSFVFRERWVGWDASGAMLFEEANGAPKKREADAYLLALGGASWPHLGADGKWTKIFEENKLPVAPLEAANCGFIVPWSDHFSEKFAGLPLKPVTLTFADRTIQGEAMITEEGLEGPPVYALSGALRDAIKKNGEAILTLDLRPGLDAAEWTKRLSKPRGAMSLSTFLRKAGGLAPQAIGLVREIAKKEGFSLEKPKELAALIKALPVRLTATASLKRAISSAGGLKLEAFDDTYMVRARPGVFVAGEMLDWDAPTGGYLLQACFSTGVAAAQGLIKWVYKNRADS